MNYYVYRITNIKYKKHYYGARQTIKQPIDDLGISYFSSSQDKNFKNEQLQYPHNFKYKIIKKFNNREDMIIFEILLHNKFDVGKNVNFYNRAKQTSKSWDASGKTCVKDINGNIFFVPTDHKKIKNGDYVGIMKGTIRKNVKKMSDATKKKLSKIKKLGYKNGTLQRRTKELNGWYGKKHSDETKKIISKKHLGKKKSQKMKDDMSKRVSGKGNPSAKIIFIFNDDNQIIYKCFGNFKQICIDNNLPHNLFVKSYRNNKKIFQNKASIAQIKDKKLLIYKDWRAQIMSKEEIEKMVL